MTQLFFAEYDEPETTGHLPPLVVFGTGGMGRETLLLLRQINEHSPTWDVRGFYDDQAPATPTVAGLPYLGSSTDLNATTERLAVAVAVGSPGGRAAVVSRLTSPLLSFPALVHPMVALTSHQRITLGEGSIVQQGCLLTCDITLGRFVLLNLGCTIGHDAVLGDFASLMPHANVSGAAQLGAGSYLGTNATVIQGVRIGENTILGASAVAVRDLPANVTAVGVPAKEIKNYR
jgi:sugar O-acyltransferase (sialic acid O-acetyltransferase NeuD family)